MVVTIKGLKERYFYDVKCKPFGFNQKIVLVSLPVISQVVRLLPSVDFSYSKS